jgi:hypothetical protein
VNELPPDGIPFATDAQLATRLRAVEAKFRELELNTLAAELGEVARILDPQVRS